MNFVTVTLVVLIAHITVLTSAQNCSSAETEAVFPTNLCDNVDDCKDGGDEIINPEDCPPCQDGIEWRCDNGHCIWEDWVCDGMNDCRDASDELQNCPACSPGYHTCDMGGCVENIYLCDQINHCFDWSDESEKVCPCSDDEIRCNAPPLGGAAGACIPAEYVCDSDGIWDCYDGMDEKNCTFS